MLFLKMKYKKIEIFRIFKHNNCEIFQTTNLIVKHMKMQVFELISRVD